MLLTIFNCNQLYNSFKIYIVFSLQTYESYKIYEDFSSDFFSLVFLQEEPRSPGRALNCQRGRVFLTFKN